MGKNKELTHQQKKDRLEELIKLTGLSIMGFGAFMDLESEDKYIYAILNGNKNLTDKFIEKIEKFFSLKEGEFLNIDDEIKQARIKKAISKFAEKNSKSPEYFNTEEEYITVINGLISQGYFSEKRTTSEIISKCRELGYSYSSNDLSYKLVNLVTQNILKAEKTTMILKSGKNGTRPINHYWVEKKEE